MKTLLNLIFLLLITSCADCNDGVQNGNETDIDCGGDCPPCVTPMEASLEGMWYYHRVVSHFSGDITTLQTGTNCKMELTLNSAGAGTEQYIAYGSIALCNYSGQTGWWINESSGYMNDAYVITLSGDSLRLDHTNGYYTYYYYK